MDIDLHGHPDQYNTSKTQDVGYYVDQTVRTCLNRCLYALCQHPIPITRTSTDQSTFVGYLSEDYRASFVDNVLLMQI